MLRLRAVPFGKEDAGWPAALDGPPTHFQFLLTSVIE